MTIKPILETCNAANDVIVYVCFIDSPIKFFWKHAM